MSDEKIFLNCPFDEKDECKELGGRWDNVARKWFITTEMDDGPFQKWLSNNEQAPSEEAERENSIEGTVNKRTYLNCPFEEKDECKSLGARWDGDAKKWYVPEGVEISKFSKWL